MRLILDGCLTVPGLVALCLVLATVLVVCGSVIALVFGAIARKREG